MASSEDILQAALSRAFSPPPSRRQSVRVTGLEAESSSNKAAETPVEPEGEGLGSSEDSWKVEYESHVETWRAQSSEAREKAEKERERWETVRVVEKEDIARRQAMGIVEQPVAVTTEQEHDTDWEYALEKDHPEPPTPHQLSSEETLEVVTQSTLATTSTQETQIPRTHSQADTGDGSQKWEEIHSSITSSFPSVTYPERTETPSPSRQHPTPAPQPPLSTTLTIFDSSLSTRTRVTALFSSLAINMLLPFVNGVMLGFGEIFAKDFVMGWFGWKPSGPGYVAASTGISASKKTPWGSQKSS